jgi:hypothetical protein
MPEGWKVPPRPGFWQPYDWLSAIGGVAGVLLLALGWVWATIPAFGAGNIAAYVMRRR